MTIYSLKMKKLDEKHRVIKDQVNMMYDLIKMGEKSLEILRGQCDHPKTKKVNYQWAPGHIMPNTTICAVCGEVIQTYQEEKENKLVWSSQQYEERFKDADE
jgi:hypothetical protein